MLVKTPQVHVRNNRSIERTQRNGPCDETARVGTHGATEELIGNDALPHEGPIAGEWRRSLEANPRPVVAARGQIVHEVPRLHRRLARQEQHEA